MSVEEVIRAGGIHTVYQPIVELPSGNVVAYEALARGPAGTQLEQPNALFAAAIEEGCVVELDWACRVAAVRGFLSANLPREVALFANVEPSAIGAPIPQQYRRVVMEAQRRLRLVVEVTERHLAARPADLLLATEAIRRRGWEVAIDDVGADRASLAVMSLVDPDVIKLDLRFVQSWGLPVVADFHAIAAHAERSGALVLAEGIETEQHLEVALALGAKYGQGWLFGRPGPLDRHASRDRFLPRRDRAGDMTAGSWSSEGPFEMVTRVREARVAPARFLLEISRHLERWADGTDEPIVLLAAFQDASKFAPAATRYAALAERLPLVVAFGVGMHEMPSPDVHGVALLPDDPLASQWVVVVLGPHTSASLIAREIDRSGQDRRFEFVVTHDRRDTLDAARTLTARIAAQTGRTRGTRTAATS